MNHEPTNYLTVYCDGGSRGNPGPAASAFVVQDTNNEVVFQQGFFLGTATNNQAEYLAVIEALRWVSTMNPEPTNQQTINFYLDSELVVKQINGLYKIKDPNLKNKYLEIKNLIANNKLLIANFINIPREKNSQADLLVNQTLDENLRK